MSPDVTVFVPRDKSRCGQIYRSSQIYKCSQQRKDSTKSFGEMTTTGCGAPGCRATRGQLQGQRRGRLVASIPLAIQGNSQH